MILFTIKKAFFDLWDNLFTLILLNLGFIAAVTIPVFLPAALADINTPLSVLSLAVGVLIVYIYAGGASLMTRDVSDYEHPGFKDFFRYVKESWASSLVFGLIALAHVFIIFFAIPVYGAMQNFLGLAAIVFLLWVSVLWLLASQYYLPLRARLDKNVVKLVKKSFILLFDNTFFTIVLGIGALVTFIISGFTAFLLPGPAAVLLWWNVGFKLRLYKYDYLEETPSADRKKIPWDGLLIDERERVGKRTIKGMIFPWKE